MNWNAITLPSGTTIICPQDEEPKPRRPPRRKAVKRAPRGAKEKKR
jgi:hypothetical protein